MEVYNRLPEHLQWHCERLWFSANVLPAVRDHPAPMFCENCLHHGLPCMNCAEYVLKGKLGPGHHNGRRVLVYSEDDETLLNMLEFTLTHNSRTIF